MKLKLSDETKGVLGVLLERIKPRSKGKATIGQSVEELDISLSKKKEAGSISSENPDKEKKGGHDVSQR